ncbi:hypothetical protein [Aquimarina rhabdastrellae]
MKKIIDIDEELVPKLKLLAALEGVSVKKLMEKSVSWYIEFKQKERIQNMSVEEREDLGLLLLMQQVSLEGTVTEEELFKKKK